MMRRLRRILLWGVPALLLLWGIASGIAARALTGRSGAARTEPGSGVPVSGLEDHRLRTEDGIDIGAWLIRPPGDRPTVLLLHGNGASRSSFSKLIPFLARERCGVMAISMRAHGDSTGAVNDFGYGARQDVLAAIAFLERELPGRRIVVVGESLGASAALFAARACAGRVQGYLLAAPYGDLETAVWNRCDSRLVPPFSQAAYVGLLMWGSAFLPENPSAIRPGDHLSDIPEATPVIVFASEDDRYARMVDVRPMLDPIRSHSTLVAVKGGDHGRFLSLHEEEYRREILKLISQVEHSP